MKVRLTLILGFLLIGGTAYAMAVSGMPVFLPEIRQNIELASKISTTSTLSKIKINPDKKISQEKSSLNSRLNNLIFQYQASRALRSSS